MRGLCFFPLLHFSSSRPSFLNPEPRTPLVPWTQLYDPLDNALLSTAMAALPVVVLLGLLAFAGWSAPRTAAAGLATALAVALFGYGMPASAAFASAGYGACFGLFPIGWIVLNAIFLYTLTVQSGQFDIVKHSVASLSADRRIQAMLIAFSFGAFIEGAAGFGTPVAISAALLIGLGFPPLYAAGLALIANTAPVAFGALGTPITTLAKVTGLDEMKLSAMAGRQLPIFSVIIPAWMVWTMSGWRRLRGVWPAVLVSGGSFAVVQFFISNYLGPTLVDVAGGLASLILLALFMRVWKPRESWDFEKGVRNQFVADQSAPHANASPPHYNRRQIINAWVPWLFLSVFVFIWGVPQVRTFLDGGLSGEPLTKRITAAGSETALAWWERPNGLAGWSLREIEVPSLHRLVYRDVPAVPKPEPENAIYRFNWLSATGTGIFISAIFSAVWMRISLRRLPAHLRRHRPPHARPAVHDRGHDGHRLRHTLQRQRRHDGSRFHAHRRDVSLLRGHARLARRRAHRLRHVLQRPLRQLAAHHRRTARTESNPHLRRQ